MLGVNERMGLKLFGREIIFEEFKPISTRYLIVTDRQTDGRTDGRTTCNLITALCASIKNVTLLPRNAMQRAVMPQ